MSPQSQFLKQSESTFGIPGQIVLFPFHYEYHNLMGNFIEIIIIRSDNNNGDDVGNGNNFSYTGGQVRRYRRWGRLSGTGRLLFIGGIQARSCLMVG